MARRQSVVSESSDFEVDPGADWEPVKTIHEVMAIFHFKLELASRPCGPFDSQFSVIPECSHLMGETENFSYPLM